MSAESPIISTNATTIASTCALSNISEYIIQEALGKFNDEHYKTLFKKIEREIEEGNIDAMITSLENGIDINDCDIYGNNLLHLAAYAGQYEITKELVKRGININALNKYGSSPLHNAIVVKCEVIEKYLISEGADVNGPNNNTPLLCAINAGNDRAVHSLIDKGAIINVCDDMGYSALHLAVADGNVKITKLLLKKGADKTAVDKHGNTAYKLAVVFRNNTIIKLFSS